MLSTKPDSLIWPGWKSVTTAKQIELKRNGPTRFRLAPEYHSQVRECWRAMEQVWEQGNWALVVDEAYYLQDRLGLGDQMIKLLTQGRSKGISVIVGMQRPSRVTRFALSEPTHVLSGKLGDSRDIKILNECIGGNYAQSLTDLQPYQFAYLDKRSDKTILVNKDSVLNVMQGKEKQNGI